MKGCKKRVKYFVVGILIVIHWLYVYSETKIKEMDYRGLKGIQMESKNFQLIILPERGANIISLIDHRTGREWFWQNPEPYKLPEYGANYVDYDISGFDDCIPTVLSCIYPDGPWKGIVIPCHGEVWAIPWEYRLGKRQVALSVHGVRLPYMFTKKITLHKEYVKIRYALSNKVTFPMKVIWAAHPLVKITPDMEIFLPKGTTMKGDISPWRVITHQNVITIPLGPPESKLARKFFTERLPQGFCGFYDTKTKDFISYVFPVDIIPYVGIWINQGAFPKDKWHYNAALEPTNVPADDIAIGTTEGTIEILPPKGKKEWEFIIFIGKAAKSDDIPQMIARKIKIRKPKK